MKKDTQPEILESHKKIIRTLKRGQFSVRDLAIETKFSQQTIRGRLTEMKKMGFAIEKLKVKGENTLYTILRKPMEKQLKEVTHTGSSHYRIALLSDTHLGAETEDLKSLNKFYEIAHSKGVINFYNSGDITDGTGVYPGQMSELKIYTGMKQVRYVIDVYPYIDKCTTFFITGNHDLKLMQREDIDVGPMIADKRKDMIYLGQYESDVYFEKAALRLIHPDGGMPYAISYRLQKYVENIAGGTKPNIISMGHLHQSLYTELRNIHCFLAGSFQQQNNFLRRKGIDPQISGWIIDFNLKNKKFNGFDFTEINNLKTQKIRFY